MSYVPPQFSIHKTLDQTISSSDVLTNDTRLVLPVLANNNYIFQFWIPFALAGIASGYKFALTGPTSPINVSYDFKITDGVNSTVINAVKTSFASTIAGVLAIIGTHAILVNGVLENGANSGNITFQFAQNISDVGTITVKRGAFGILRPI